MDDSLPFLLSFPTKFLHNQDYDSRAISYIQELSRFPSSTWTSRRGEQSLLDVLNPNTNSIPYTFALLEHLRNAHSKETETVALLPYLAQYFQQFDPVQVKYISKQWHELFAYTADAYDALRVPDIAVLGYAVLKLDPIVNTFTTSHLTYLRLCSRIGRLSLALPLLDRNIYSYLSVNNHRQEQTRSDQEEGHSTAIPNRSVNASSQDILEYYVLGGSIYASQRQWTRAQLFLEFAVLYPSPHGTTSALQAEAYKKWILVTLMLDGKVSTHSWATGGQVMKNIRAVSKAYEALAESFQRRDWRKFQAELDVGSTIWQQDGTAALANATNNKILQHCVQDLRNTFTALPVSRLANHLGVTSEQASQLIANLISSGQLDARIDTSASDHTLIFGSVDDAVTYGDDAIAVQKARIEELMQNVKDASVQLLLSPEYIEATRKAKRQGFDGDPADQMDLEYSSQTVLPSMLTSMDDDGDEDIMS